MEVQGNQNYEHEIVDNGCTMGWKFELKFQLARQFHLKIRNAKANKEKLLEQKTIIQLPQGDSMEVIIKGNSESEVISTKQRIIELLLPGQSSSSSSGLSSSRPRSKAGAGENRRPSQKLTHFLSIPLTTDDIKKNFSIFNDDVINSFGLHKSLLQKPEKLHLTIVMLALSDEDDEAKAIGCLNLCQQTIIDPILNGKLLTVSLAGVDVFSDENPSAAYVLFGKVISEDLQQIANQVSKFFADQGLGKPYKSRNSQQQEDVKLHATLINSQFFKEDDSEVKAKKSTGKRFQKRKPFNATAIIKKYKDFNFGSLQVNEIQISRLEGEKDANGFYSSIGNLKF